MSADSKAIKIEEFFLFYFVSLAAADAEDFWIFLTIEM